MIVKYEDEGVCTIQVVTRNRERTVCFRVFKWCTGMRDGLNWSKMGWRKLGLIEH